MFIHSDSYKNSIQDLIKENEVVKIAAAFWGEGSEQIFHEHKGKTFQIICNLTMGGTNPDPIEKLMKVNGIEVKMLSDLHAKVVLGKESAIIGSANFSTNGLGLQDDEACGWREAGFVTRDLKSLEAVRIWFDNLWSDAEIISPEDIRRAKKIWADRRKNRPRIQQVTNLLDAPLSMLKDLPIYVALYQGGASRKAVAAYKETRDDLEQDTSRPFPIKKLRFYENWKDLAEDGPVIGIKYTKKGKLRIDNAAIRFPQLDIETGDEEDGVSVQFTIDTSDVLGMKFGLQEKKLLHDMVLPYAESIWRSHVINKIDTAAEMSLHDFLVILEDAERSQKIFGADS